MRVCPTPSRTEPAGVLGATAVLHQRRLFREPPLSLCPEPCRTIGRNAGDGLLMVWHCNIFRVGSHMAARAANVPGLAISIGMSRLFVVGIDIGTQSLKAVVLDAGLQPVGSAARAYQPGISPAPLGRAGSRALACSAPPGDRRRAGRRPGSVRRCGRPWACGSARRLPAGRRRRPGAGPLSHLDGPARRCRDRRHRCRAGHGEGRSRSRCFPYGGQDPLAEAPSCRGASPSAAFISLSPMSYRG